MSSCSSALFTRGVRDTPRLSPVRCSRSILSWRRAVLRGGNARDARSPSAGENTAIPINTIDPSAWDSRSCTERRRSVVFKGHCLCNHVADARRVPRPR